MDQRFPNLKAVPEVPLNDLTRLEDDALYAAGMEIVQQILEEMAAVGRTKRPKFCQGSKEDCDKKGWTKREQADYTGTNALLAVEEYEDLGCCAKWQRVMAQL